MQPHNRSKPKTQQRVKPNLYIETEFESEDDAANTVVLRLPDNINEYEESGEGFDPNRNFQRSFVENLQFTEQVPRIRPLENNPVQQYAIALKTLNIFQKLWKRRMLIECFNALRLTRASGLTRQQSQTDFRHKHSTSLVEPQRGRWALLHDRSVNRIGSAHEDSSMERARLLNEIVDKLSHRSSSRRLPTVEQPILTSPSFVVRESEAQIQHQRTIEHKLDRLQTMLRDIKRVHQASTVQSAVYSMKRPEPQRRRKRKVREEQRNEIKDEVNHSYLLRQERSRIEKERRLSQEQRERARQSRQRREREFFDRQRLRLESERQHYARLEAEKQLQLERESRTEFNRQLLRNESVQHVLELSKEVASLKEEVRHLKSIGEASGSQPSQSPRNNLHVSPPSIMKQLYDKTGGGERSPHPSRAKPLFTHTTHSQYATTNYLPYSVPLQQPTLIQESRQNTHLPNSSFVQPTTTTVYTQPIVTKSPVYMQHRSFTHVPFQPVRTKMVETHKLQTKPPVDYGPRLGSPPGMTAVLNRSRSPTSFHNCPLCGCGVCNDHKEKCPPAPYNT